MRKILSGVTNLVPESVFIKTSYPGKLICKLLLKKSEKALREFHGTVQCSKENKRNFIHAIECLNTWKCSQSQSRACSKHPILKRIILCHMKRRQISNLGKHENVFEELPHASKYMKEGKVIENVKQERKLNCENNVSSFHSSYPFLPSILSQRCSFWKQLKKARSKIRVL